MLLTPKWSMRCYLGGSGSKKYWEHPGLELDQHILVSVGPPERPTKRNPSDGSTFVLLGVLFAGEGSSPHSLSFWTWVTLWVSATFGNISWPSLSNFCQPCWLAFRSSLARRCPRFSGPTSPIRKPTESTELRCRSTTSTRARGCRRSRPPQSLWPR